MTERAPVWHEDRELVPGSPQHRQRVLGILAPSLTVQIDSTLSCEWGNCDEETVTGRLSPLFGWLPVCQGHRLQPEARYDASYVPAESDIDLLTTRRGCSRVTAVLLLGGLP